MKHMDRVCRICMSDEYPDDLCCPCDCKGSNKWVHGKCQITWVITAKRSTCEVCKYKWVSPKRYPQNQMYLDIDRFVRDVSFGVHLIYSTAIYYTKHIIIKMVT